MGLHPDVTAGLSLGEYCAIEAAGGMELKGAVTTVRKRGILMEQAVPAGKGSMAAVMGMEKCQRTVPLRNACHCRKRTGKGSGGCHTS